MSQANKHTIGPADEASVASRTRRQTRIRARDEADDEKQPAAPSSSHVSPAMRLYRHALESVLGMLELGDLSRALVVSRSWSAAVRSMAPIHAVIDRGEWQSECEKKAFVPLPPVETIVGSPLLRHLADIEISYSGRDDHEGLGSWTPLDNASLGFLAQHALNLTSLHCTLTLTPNEPLLFPARLTGLDLQLNGEYTDSAINGLLTTLAALPSLSRLGLWLSVFAHTTSVDLGQLAASNSLTDLTIETTRLDPPQLSDAQVDRIRLSLGHLRRFSVGWMESDDLARFLKPPVTARWRDIGTMRADERSGGLLVRLQTLTKLDLYYNSDAADVDFLSQLPLLTELQLDCDKPPEDEAEDAQQTWFIPADAVLASLVLCPDLTDLGLSCGLKSAQWSALLSKLPKIKKLDVGRGEFDTMQCFATGPITELLEELFFSEGDLPPSEVAHLYALRRLRTLWLVCCFFPRLDDATIDSLSPPTPIFPALTEFVHQWRPAPKQRPASPVNRRGPSFEWMQQRLTQ